MAQARKKSTAKPKKSNNSSKGGGNQPLVILIILVVIGLAIFGLQYASEHMNTEPITLSWGSDEKQQTESSSPKSVNKEIKKTVATQSKTATETKKNTPPPIDEAFDEEEMVETVKPNEDLPTYTSTDSYYFSKSFDFAWPKYTQNDQIIEHEFYTLKYNEKTEQADWVAYKLTATNLKNAKFKRKDDFRPDPAVQTKSAHPDDYKGSGYDRGHLAPAADFTWDESGLSETFYMSNMSPQAPGFNRGIWRSLEEKVRDWAIANKEVFVVTGPIYEGKTSNIGKNHVAIPSGYYKVIIELQGSDVKAIAFSLPNESVSGQLYEFAMTVDDLEKATGMDFFPSIPDDLENKVESYYDYSAW
ncbi:DNA/RNA non-specific endonuclease [Reichenbachiella agarivorans]|uniref:Endonuclease n=1 Tax=Reichenbachiella agarivorans TaxID=2979464 RepID=A0ABY6CMV3_9BACT|nr:DNA/RNA non-specific endonuclease [Reichenbachiella agarivorans]UXP31390.1 DNA/RNA non-specific endonuclease [Reichenbachiella agarivorans]